MSSRRKCRPAKTTKRKRVALRLHREDDPEGILETFERSRGKQAGAYAIGDRVKYRRRTFLVGGYDHDGNYILYTPDGKHYVDDAKLSDPAQRRNPNPQRTSVLPARKLNRPPVNLHDAELADLKGHLDRIALDNGRELRWGAGEAKAFWHPESQSLVAFHGFTPPATRAGNAGGARARDAFERWTGRRARRGGELTVNAPEHWASVGRSVVLDYFSRKWPGKGPSYTHDTTTRPRVYRMGGARPPWIWVVRGGGFQLTTRGLVG